MSFEIRDGNITIGGKLIGNPINTAAKQAVEWNGLIVVLFWKDESLIKNTNVMAFDLGGNRVWTIQEAPPRHGTTYNPYFDINLDTENRLIAYNAAGYEWFVNATDGTIKRVDPTARPW